MKNLLSFPVVLLAVWALASAPAAAQPTTGGPSPGTPPASVPVDGGASLLLAGGLAYAVRKLRQRRLR